jgi:hypothetical protein
MRCLTAALPFLLLVAGCGGGTTVMIPPQLALAPYQPVGLIAFTTENARGALGSVATDRFRDEIFAAQSGVEILEMGNQDTLLAAAGRSRLDPEAVRAIGEREGVSALFAGHLGAQDPNEAYGELVGLLVGRVTRDLRPTYERR